MKKLILLVAGYGYEKPFKQMGELVEDIDLFMQSPEKFKLVVFTGGEDVHPAMYGHTSPKGLCYFNAARDVKEQIIYEFAKDNNIPMTGICRGSQFLNVMAGGTLMHHIDHHGTMHYIETIDGTVMKVTSTHHQMCVPAEDGFVVAWSETKRSERYFGDKDVEVAYDGKEVEAIYYPDKKIFAVQYHPEYMDDKSMGLTWYRQAVHDLVHFTTAEFKRKYFKQQMVK